MFVLVFSIVVTISLCAEASTYSQLATSSFRDKLDETSLTQGIKGDVGDHVEDDSKTDARRLEDSSLPDLTIDFGTSPTKIPFDSVAPYRWNNGNRDGGGSIDISPDGSVVKLLGNVWKSFPIPTYSVTPNTVLEFDLSILDLRNYHGICLDVDQDGFRNQDGGPGTCFYLAGNSAAPRFWHRVSAPGGASLENRRHYIIDVGGLIIAAGQSVRPVSFIAFVTDENDDPTLGQAIFRSIRVHDGDGFGANPQIQMRIRKSTTLVVPNGRPYSWSGGFRDGGGHFDLTKNGKELTFTGNNWKVFAMDTYSVNADTVLEFDLAIPVRSEYHGICLDLDQDVFRNTDSGPNNCFYLGGSRPPSRWIRVNAPGGDFATSRHYMINAGELIVPAPQVSRVVRFLGFITESDAPNELFGEMTIGNLKLHDGNDFDDDVHPRLRIQVRGKKKTWVVPNGQSYLGNLGQQDGGGYFDLSPNGKSLTLVGNNWKAFQIEPYSVSPDTILEFDLTILQQTGLHAICLDGDLDAMRNVDSGPGTCFFLGGTQRPHLSWTRVSAPSDDGATTTTRRHYIIDVGALFGLTMDASREVRYLAFVSNSDVDMQFGESTFANIKIHEGRHFDETAAQLRINVRGVSTTIVPNGLSYKWIGSVQDGIGYFNLSPDGKAISLHGNAWKAFRLASPYRVTNSTVLEFDMTITAMTKGHFICLDGDLDGVRNADGGLKNCFYGGGTGSTFHFWVLDPPPVVGVKTRYVINVGQQILQEGQSERIVNFIAVVSDSDVDPTFGESTFGNLELHDGDKSGGGGDDDAADCKDDLRAKFFLKINAGKQKNCRWLRNKKKEKQRKKICQSESSNADEVCRELCDTCV